MSSFVANLNLNSQDVEEGQLPDDANQQPLGDAFAPPERIVNSYQLPQTPINNHKQPQLLSPNAQKRPPISTPYTEIVFETIKYNSYQKDYSNSPDSKKKTKKSHHKSLSHSHHSNQRDRQRLPTKYDRKEKQMETFAPQKTNNYGPYKEDMYLSDPNFRQNGYPPSPYYPPYMYPPIHMMPPHMPPNMYPYPMPPPYMPPPGSYPYPPNSMMPPMHMAPPPHNYPIPNDPYINSQVPYENNSGGYKRQGIDTGMGSDNRGQKSGENGYKMFGMGGHYMYPYPPPPIGYPGYPPPPYMMYPPPQVYEAQKQMEEMNKQDRAFRKKQIIDNQKQKIKKDLKHFSNEKKLQILQTIRNILKFDSKPLEQPQSSFPDYPTISTQTQSLRTQIESKLYQRSLQKLGQWLSQEDDRQRDTINQLLTHFHLENIKEKIQQAKNNRKTQIQSNKSQVRRLLDRLLISQKQIVL